VQVTAWGREGRLRAQQTLRLEPWQERTYTLPDGIDGLFSLVIRAAAPVTVAGAPSGSLGFAAGPALSWYSLRPAGSSLALFDPDQVSAALVDVQFVGTHAVTGEQIRVAPHRLFILSTHQAHAVRVSSSAPIAVAYHQPSRQAGALVTQPGAEAAFAASGPARKLTVFNPGAQPAHLDFSILGRAASTERTAVLAPSGVSTFSLGAASPEARGVLLKSDVPIVAGASG
jgi:hypothetical protein